MPSYDYHCTACGHTFEVFQSITAPKKRKCPQCGRLKLRRLIGPGAAIIFKGSGFYATDYRKDKPCNAPPPDATTAPAKTRNTTTTPDT